MSVTIEEKIKIAQDKHEAYLKSIDDMSPKQKTIRKLLAPFGILFLVAIVVAFLGKNSMPLAIGFLLIVGIGMIYSGIKKEENKFIKVYFVILGSMFSIPAAANVLAFFGF
ncbi:MAG: hypothetical protein PHW89_07075 [Sulfurimonas denitrificans]|nr:hypothetical protein [Sulfurimonas denitrificans]